jgi:hypothetical protein
MLARLYVAGCITLSTLGAVGCASVGNQYVATPVDQRSRSEAERSGLRLSAEETPELSSPYFGVIQLTVENRGAEFLRVDAVSLDFGGPEHNRHLSVPLGADLASWAAATAQRSAIRQYNTQLALGTLALFGAVASAVGDAHGQPGIAALGAGTSLLALTALTVSELDAHRQELQTRGLLPDGHLLAVPFSVPPALFATKWIVLRSNDAFPGCTDSMNVAIHLQGGGNWQQLRTRFRNAARGRSEWQAAACRKRTERYSTE